MKIDGWRISSFGILRDYEIGDLPAGLTVLFGPNEAGKTTLLEFIRQMLFGLTDAPDGMPTYPPLRGGRYGGRLCVSDPAGSYAIERYDDSQRPPLVVRPDGSTGDGADIDHLLGGCDRQLFESVFTFSLTELQDFARLDVESVHDRIFSAGISGAGRSVREATGDLAHRRKLLFSEGDDTSRLSELARQLSEVERCLAEARSELDRYPALLLRRDGLASEIDRLADQLEETLAGERRWRLLADLWPVWYRRQTISAELEQLELPAEMPSRQDEARLSDLNATIEQARSASLRLASEVAALNEQRAELQPDPSLLDEQLSRDVSSLIGDFPHYQEQASLLEQTALRLHRQEHERDDRLRQLGAGWNATRVLAFDESAVDRNRVRQHSESLRRGEQDVAAKSAVVAMARRQVEAFRRSTSELLVASEPEPPPTLDEIEQRQTALAGLRDIVGELSVIDARIEEANQARARLEEARNQIASAAATDAGRGLLGALRRLFGLQPRSDVTIQDAIHEQQQRIERDLADYASRREERLKASSAVRETAQFAGPLELAGIDAESRRLAGLSSLAERRDRAKSELAGLERSLTSGQEALDRASEQLVAAQRSWTEWKSANGLHRTLSPESAIETLDLLRQTAEAERQVQLLSRECDRLSQQTGAYQTRAAAILQRLALPPADDFALAIESLRTRLASNNETARRRLMVEQRLAEAEQRRMHAERRLAVLESESDQLFRDLGVSGQTEFRRAVELRAMRDERLATVQECDARLASRIEAEPDGEWLREQLQLGDIDHWQREREGASHLADEIMSGRDALVAERHDIDGECRRLETSDLIPKLEQRQAGLQSAFQEALTDWWRLSLAEQLIVDTQARFERERQPAVLAAASNYFATLTAGAYHRLRQQEHRIVVIDRHGRARSPEALSRGTIEQLYLCIRLGLVTDFAERVVPLPLVLDDVLVNVDPQRARLVAEVLARIAGQHQILLFTCHPETAGVLRSVIPECGLYAMSRYGGGIRAVPAGPVQPDRFSS